jgi:hypothetical protein
MGNISVYRIQDHEGRGQFKPGFSAIWSDEFFVPGVEAMPTWIEEFGHDLVERLGFPGEHYGSAVRTLPEINKWFSANEQERLRRMGYNIVSMTVDRILAESKNQLVFARKKPLYKHVVIIHRAAA